MNEYKRDVVSALCSQICHVFCLNYAWIIIPVLRWLLALLREHVNWSDRLFVFKFLLLFKVSQTRTCIIRHVVFIFNVFLTYCILLNWSNCAKKGGPLKFLWTGTISGRHREIENILWLYACRLRYHVYAWGLRDHLRLLCRRLNKASFQGFYISLHYLLVIVISGFCPFM